MTIEQLCEEALRLDSDAITSGYSQTRAAFAANNIATLARAALKYREALEEIAGADCVSWDAAKAALEETP